MHCNSLRCKASYEEFSQGDCYATIILRKVTPELDPEQCHALREYTQWSPDACQWLCCGILTTLLPRSLPKRPPDPAMDPFSLFTSIAFLISISLKLIVVPLCMVDETLAAYDDAIDELKGLQQNLEQLREQTIHTRLKVLATNTKDRGFKKLLQQ